MKQEMGDKRDIRPFIYGGVASIIAEFGKFFFLEFPIPVCLTNIILY